MIGMITRQYCFREEDKEEGRFRKLVKGDDRETRFEVVGWMEQIFENSSASLTSRLSFWSKFRME